MNANLDKVAAYTRFPLLVHTLPLWDGMKNELVGIHVTNRTHLVIRFEGTFNRSAWKDNVDALQSRHTILAARVVDGHNGLEFVLKQCEDDHAQSLDISRVDDKSLTAKQVVSDLGGVRSIHASCSRHSR